MEASERLFVQTVSSQTRGGREGIDCGTVIKGYSGILRSRNGI